MENNEKYIFYQYLKFIWNKKWWLVGAMILFMLIGLLYSLRQPLVYTGQAVIFTGNAQNDKLSKPVFIKSEYQGLLPDKVRNSFAVDLPGDNQMVFTVSEQTKKGADEDIRKVANSYVKDLQKRYQDQKTELKAAVKIVDIKQLKREYKNYVSGLIQSKENITFYRDTIQWLTEAKYQLAIMEPPKLMDVTTTQRSNNLIRNMLLGGAFGFQLMLIILVFWKYIRDARRSLNS